MGSLGSTFLGSLSGETVKALGLKIRWEFGQFCQFYAAYAGFCIMREGAMDFGCATSARAQSQISTARDRIFRNIDEDNDMLVDSRPLDIDTAINVQ